MKLITTFEELKNVVANTPIVVIDIFAEWCAPCQEMMPVVEELSGENPDVPFYKVDIDMVPDAKVFTGVKAIPMVVMYKGGRRKEFTFGVVTKEVIQQKLDRVVT